MLCWGKHRELQQRQWNWAVCTAEEGLLSTSPVLLRFKHTVNFLTSHRSARSRSCGNQRAGCFHSWFGWALLFFFTLKEKYRWNKNNFQAEVVWRHMSPREHGQAPCTPGRSHGNDHLALPWRTSLRTGGPTHYTCWAGRESNVSQSKLHCRGFYGSVLVFPSFSTTTITISSLVVMFSAAL